MDSSSSLPLSYFSHRFNDITKPQLIYGEKDENSQDDSVSNEGGNTEASVSGPGPLYENVDSPLVPPRNATALNETFDPPEPVSDLISRPKKEKSATEDLLSSVFRSSLQTVLVVTVSLYLLNQCALLPKPLAAVVSKVLFWPTLPLTVTKRFLTTGGRSSGWMTEIDDTVIMGGAPFAALNLPQNLYDKDVRGVINLCQEYRSPTDVYETLDMEELWLPTVDHFIPDITSLNRAVDFIQRYHDQGKDDYLHDGDTKKSNASRVYVHCRAGHGRSAAVVFCWLLSKNPFIDRQNLNRQFSKLRNVKSTLWRQPSIIEFHEQLLKKQEQKIVGYDASEVYP